ncbi:DUF6378 domain-containing protein [Mycobacteroides abscessus]|uniref:DUF6378 domain-containing protein n=1 Tax=Mycobacteroides abscessus TaxID=36809 RepID=UPI000927AC0F|nr:DUF6378 domain-containing protein [Mycobacteroides abscessus]SIE08650.1 Uncharacterised protein [Mycobacteroides abscessus subsp. abscessus]
MTESILQEAERIINGDRAEQYGDPKVMFERIAEFWTSYLYPFTEALTPVDVANMMVLLKISRSKAAVDRGEYHRDDHVDIAGYAGLTEKLGAAVDVVEGIPTPRQWVRIEDVPSGVRVTDKDHDVFVWEYGNLMFRGDDWGCVSTTFNENLGPFTEVLDG